MVQLIPNKGMYPSLESTLTLTEGQLAKIKANEKKFINVCKDLNIAHTYYEDENGNIVSKTGHMIRKACDAMMASTELHEKHCKLLEIVDSWEDKVKSAEEPAKETSEKEKLPNIDDVEEFFFLCKTKDGYRAYGEMNLLTVLRILYEAVNKVTKDILAHAEEPE
jgi:hypothetical protein